MLRLCLCLLIAVSSATAVAREVKLSSPNSGACPDAKPATAKSDAIERTPAATPSRATEVKPSVHSDAPSRLSSPRWHSFLPGMFR
ncbi:hypothetical protein [Lysobacter sp. F60174L2]|uniref:hypothetical protein n=1 Tax=Lysobacter sp. F60174L2 TaxID=3459295 RepID=UPI00403D736C